MKINEQNRDELYLNSMNVTLFIILSSKHGYYKENSEIYFIVIFIDDRKTGRQVIGKHRRWGLMVKLIMTMDVVITISVLL